MKFSKSTAAFYALILATAFAVFGLGCAQQGVKEQKQIATACAGITAAVDAIAAGVEQGKVSKDDGRAALALAQPTAGFCEPKPKDHLDPVDYAALLTAAADLATLKKEKLR